MNWLRHELRLRAHKVGRAIQFMTRSVKSWSEARNHDASLRASIHDGNAVKSSKKTKVILSETRNFNLHLFGITYRKEISK